MSSSLTEDNDDETAKFESLYELQNKLQSGSYGTVYVALVKKKENSSKEEESNKVAVKVIDRTKFKRPERETEAIRREAAVMRELKSASINNPNVIQLLNFMESPSKFYMVMELANGGDLFDKLGKLKSYTEQDARDLSLQLLDAIQYMHQHDIVHRDLKPENLLLSSNGQHDFDFSVLKVADFGFARKIPEGEFLKTKCGTPSYIAPEILVGQSYGKSPDIWSTGVVVFMMIAGYPPFQARNHRELFRKIRAADYQFRQQDWNSVSLQAKQLVDRLLTVNVKHRFNIMQACQSDWITSSEELKLSSVDLSKSLRRLDTFRAKEKLKGAVHATHWAMTAKFWNADKVTFTKQCNKWDSLFESQQLKRITFESMYTLGKQIQKGSMATVYECAKHGGGIYAVKVIEREGLSNLDDEDVLNEVAVLKSLNHRNIVQLVDFFEEEDRFYMVMEYMVGGDVFDRIIHRKRYTEADARDLSRTLLETVKFMHEQGVAHRDLKPQNLLLKSTEDDADIKVADFGFAKRVHTPRSLVTRCGTPMYVAPEILKNAPHDEAVDMWSVGAVIFVLLVGYPPFAGESRKELFANIRIGNYKFVPKDWSHISPEARDLIVQLLKVDPSERLTARQALQSEWITEPDEQLCERDLSLDDIKQRNSRWKKVAGTVKWLSMSSKTKEEKDIMNERFKDDDEDVVSDE